MRVVYCSQFRDSSGYASAARGYLKALDTFLAEFPDAFELKVHTIIVEHTSRLSNEELALLEKYEFRSNGEIDTWIQNPYLILWHQPPPMMTIERFRDNEYWVAGRRLLDNATCNVNLTVWEADDIPDYWNEVYDRFDTSAVIVPSKWNLETLSNRVDRNVYHVPHVLEDDIVNPKPIYSLEDKIKDKFTVLSVGQWQNRKGFDLLIPAFCMEFGRSSDAILLVKTYGTLMKGVGMPQEEQAKQIATEIVNLKNSVFMDDGRSASAEIALLPDVMPFENLSWLYNEADLFALLTRGEGFGLPVAESLLHKTPVLITERGGHVDFINPGAAFFVEGHWSPYVNRPEYSCNMNWYEPHMLSARKQLRTAYEMWKTGNDLAHMGHVGYQDILEGGYDSFSIGERLFEIFEKEYDSEFDVELMIKEEETVKDITNKVKWKLDRLSSLEDKVAFLKNKYEGETAYILTCGPSLNDYSSEYLVDLLRDKLTITVKQAYDKVKDVADFHLFNCANLPLAENGTHYNYGENKPIVVASSNYMLGQRWNAKKQDVDVFFKIPIRTEIDDQFLCKTRKFDDFLLEKTLERSCAPGIMFETVFYTAVHLGVSKIVVLGWDLEHDAAEDIEEHKHFYGSTSGLVNRGDILDWEMRVNREASKDLYYWLKDRGVELEIASNRSTMYEGIPRVKL
tara:strand:+ start:16249 stop:18291 length:2043 start_codon:yes stop_codon:yes gene_type:complete